MHSALPKKPANLLSNGCLRGQLRQRDFNLIVARNWHDEIIDGEDIVDVPTSLDDVVVISEGYDHQVAHGLKTSSDVIGIDNIAFSSLSRCRTISIRRAQTSQSHTTPTSVSFSEQLAGIFYDRC